MNKYNNPLVTVIILCYQNYNYLQRCIESVLTQNYENIEIIISDDGSDFFDEEEIKKYIEENKKENISNYYIIVNKENHGTVWNLKNAMTYMNGEYYITGGADDTFYNDTIIQKYVNFFNNNVECVWVCGLSNQIKQDTNKIIEVFPTNNDISILKTTDAIANWQIWARRGVANSLGICYKSETLKITGGYDDSYKYMEDWPYNIKLLLKS